MNDPIRKKSWEEFRKTGLFLFINQILHAFGWVLVYDKDHDSVYPARTVFRGFSESSQTKAYQNISTYLKENVDSIYEDTFEG